MARFDKSLLSLLEREDSLLARKKCFDETIEMFCDIQKNIDEENTETIEDYSRIIDREKEEREEILRSIYEIRCEMAEYFRDTLKV